jgi:hypothetical protein
MEDQLSRSIAGRRTLSSNLGEGPQIHGAQHELPTRRSQPPPAAKAWGGEPAHRNSDLTDGAHLGLRIDHSVDGVTSTALMPAKSRNHADYDPVTLCITRRVSAMTPRTPLNYNVVRRQTQHTMHFLNNARNRLVMGLEARAQQRERNRR